MRIFLSTADASGDMHGSALVEALHKRESGLEVFGLGGKALEAAGFERIVAQADLAVAGLVEILPSLPRMAGGYLTLRRALRSRAPDLAILVDSPDLNIPLASVAHRIGIPVLYYIAPQVWAWRPGRLRKLRRCVDHMGVIFPFEERIFREADVPVTFVGHPLVDRMQTLQRSFRRDEVAKELELDLERPVLGLLPGSRRNELSGNLPVFVETAAALRAHVPELQIRLCLAPTLEAESVDVPEWLPVVRGRTHEVMALSTALLSAAGTSTVEAALLGVPLVVVHRVNRISAAIAQRIARVPSTCMVNLIAEAGIVPERLQERARPSTVLPIVLRWLRDPQAREEMSQNLSRAVSRLGPPGAAERAADLALEVARRS